MTPDDREFGELVAEVRGLRGDVSDLSRRNTAEHAANAARMQRIEDKLESGLDRKADRATVERQGTQIAELSSSQQRTVGRDGFIKAAFGALIALATIYVANGGHIHL